MKLHFFFLFFVGLANANDAVLKSALAVIPGQKLSLEFVLKTAIEKSASYKALATTKMESEATRVGSEDRYDWILLADYMHLDQDKDTLTPFEPGEIKKDNYGIGVRKYFSTGTQFETKWGRSFNQIAFSDSSIQVPNYEDTLTFTLKQNLWADFFGISSRAEYRSLELTSQSQDYQHKINQQIWALGLVDLYHGARLSQKQLLAAREDRIRRKRLLDVTRLKFQKGTAERQDLLQVQAASLASETRFSEADSNLNETWRSLVINLDLPTQWLEIQPENIPMVLSDFSTEAFDLCHKPLDETKTWEVLKAESAQKAAKETLRAAQQKDQPKLELIGGYNTNGIASSQDRSQKENWGADHPSWNIGLQLEMPLGNSGAKSNRLKAAASELRAQSDYETTLDNKTIEVKTLCEKLKKSEMNVKNAELAFQNQKERLELEEKRFRFGRANTFSVIQAGDDKSQSELVYSQSQVEFRKLSWQVFSATSELSKWLEKWKNL